MAHAPAHATLSESEPLGSINVTPLIDVLLVLLIMLILTIPMATHSVPLNLPRPAPKVQAFPQHRLVLTAAGAVALDGVALSDAELPGALARLGSDALVIDADPAARYGRFDALLATVRRAGVTRLGFADNSRFAKF